MAEAGCRVVQCSTGSLAPLGGGRYWNAGAMLDGVLKLGWPAIELRLWQEWDDDLVAVARKAHDAGFQVNSVHVPPDSEALLSTPGCQQAAQKLMDKCAEAALAAGARVAVVHAWDLRRPQFSEGTLLDNLNALAGRLGSQGVSLSVESIPGHVRMLPAIAQSCPGVSFTPDTQWAALEDSWALLKSLMPRTVNVHVQTYVDPVPEGVALGRTATGWSFDAEAFARGLVTAGYRGLVTLEPHGIPAVGETHLRQALDRLQSWLQETP